MKIIIILLFVVGASGPLSAVQTNSTVYVYGEKVTPEAAIVKVSRLLSGSVDEKLEAMDVLLRYPKDIDAAPFLPNIRNIANQVTPYSEMDKFLKASKGQGTASHVALSPKQEEEFHRLTLQSLAICVLSVSNPGSMDPLLSRLSASGSPSLELAAKNVPKILNHFDHTRKNHRDLATESAREFSLSLNLIYGGTIPYSKEIGNTLLKRYQGGDLSFSDKALLLAVLRVNKFEGAEEIITELSKSKSAEDRELPTVIADLVKNH